MTLPRQSNRRRRRGRLWPLARNRPIATTKSGTQVTEQLADELAREAEAGYDLSGISIAEARERARLIREALQRGL